MNESRVDRRAFLAMAGRGAATVVVTAVATMSTTRHLGAQTGASQPAAGVADMSGEEYRPVRRPPKSGATAQMDKAAIETFERRLACPCPCTLDVYTCRTTMFSCSISPAVHGDIEVLVNGGYSADEIMTAMTDTYGDFILMTPRKQGFNLLAWAAPFGALGIGALGVGMLLRGWRRNANIAADARAAGVQRDAGVDASGTDATPDELARLESALRDDSR